jgi:hypothetical protein
MVFSLSSMVSHRQLGQFRGEGANPLSQFNHSAGKQPPLINPPVIPSSLIRSSALRQWSGFDVRYPLGRTLAKRTSNPKLHWNQYFLVVL